MRAYWPKPTYMQVTRSQANEAQRQIVEGWIREAGANGLDEPGLNALVQASLAVWPTLAIDHARALERDGKVVRREGRYYSRASDTVES